MGQLKRANKPIVSLNRGLLFELRGIVRINRASAKYDMKIPDALHGSRYDARVGNKLDEFKSVSDIGKTYKIGEKRNKVNQLLDYFGGINNIDDFSLTFDSKALPAGVDAVDEMKTVIENLRTHIFPRMSMALRNDLEIMTLSDLNVSVINNIVNKIVKVD